jgi:hypothetical protein
MSTTNDAVAQQNALGYPLLQTATPVPSDIAISQHVVASGALLSIEKVGQQYVYSSSTYITRGNVMCGLGVTVSMDNA